MVLGEKINENFLSYSKTVRIPRIKIESYGNKSQSKNSEESDLYIVDKITIKWVHIFIKVDNDKISW